MTQPVYQPPSPQTIGEVLDSAFGIFRISLVKCLPHGVLSMIAGQLPNIYLLAIGKPLHRFGGGDPLWWVLYVLGALIGLVFFNAMLIRQLSIANRRPTRVRGELLEALRKLPAIIALLIGTLVLIGIGLVALVIPGLYLMVALILAWPALLLDGRNPQSAIRYSLHLTRRNWWRITAVYTVALFTAMVFYIVVFALLAIVLPLAGANDFAMFTAASVVVLIALGAVGTPFSGAILLAVYGDLKLRKEGTDLASRLAGVVPA